MAWVTVPRPFDLCAQTCKMRRRLRCHAADSWQQHSVQARPAIAYKRYQAACVPQAQPKDGQGHAARLTRAVKGCRVVYKIGRGPRPWLQDGANQEPMDSQLPSGRGLNAPNLPHDRRTCCSPVFELLRRTLGSGWGHLTPCGYFYAPRHSSHAACCSSVRSRNGNRNALPAQPHALLGGGTSPVAPIPTAALAPEPAPPPSERPPSLLLPSTGPSCCWGP